MDAGILVETGHFTFENKKLITGMNIIYLV